MPPALDNYLKPVPLIHFALGFLPGEAGGVYPATL